MTILNRVNNPDPDDDNNKIKVSNVQFSLARTTRR